MTRTGLAEVFGVSMPTVDSWVRAGCPVVKRGSRGVEWQFDTAEVIKWREQRAADMAAGDTKADETELRRRELLAKTLTAELELAKKRGEVAPIRDFERAQAAVFAEIRTNIMNVPQRVVVQLLGEANEVVFKQKLRAELTLALEAAATADLVLSDDDETDDADDDS